MSDNFYNKVFRHFPLGSLWLIVMGILPYKGQAQVYYSINDGSGSTSLDQLRRVALAGGAEQTIVASSTPNFPASPGALAFDQTNNRILVLNSINNSPRIVAVDLGTNAVTTLVSPATIPSVNTQITGIAVAGGFVYYSVNDGSGSTSLDQLRRVALAGGAEQTIVASSTPNFPASPGALAFDQTNNRILVLNSINNSPRIVAVDLGTNAVTTLVSPATIPSVNTQITGIAVAGGFVYYSVNDGSGSTSLDQLRRVALAGGAEQTIVASSTPNFPASPGALAFDQTNNRILVLNSINNSPRIVAVDLGTNAVTTLVSPATIPSVNTQITGIAVAGGVSLPVTLTGFMARRFSEQTVGIEWQTGSEINADYFEIQRSLDAREFNSIARLKTQGNTLLSRSYRYLDSQPLLQTTYYRLRIVDHDGTFSYSRIESVTPDDQHPLLRIVENPISKNNGLRIWLRGFTGDEVILTSVTGQRIPFQTLIQPDGSLLLTPSIPLSSGIYLIRAGQQNRAQSVRVLVP